MVFILQLLENTKTIGENLEWVFYIFFPNFCFAYSLQEMYTNYANRVACEALESNVKENYGDLVPGVNLDMYCDLISRLNQTSPCCPGEKV